MPFLARARRLARILGAALLPLLVPALAPAGWEVEYALRTGEPGPETVLVRIDADHARISPAGEESEVVVGPEGFTVVDHAKKTVMTVTYAQLETMFGGMAAMMESMKEAQRKALEEAAGDLSPEERAAFEESMQAEESSVEFKPSGETSSVAGLSAAKIVVLEEGEEIGHLFVTESIPATAITGPLERLMDVVPRSFLEQEEDMAVLLDAVRDVRGFPVRLVSLRPGDEGEVTAVSAREVDLPADTWTAPAGYTREPFPLFDMGGGGDDGGW